MCKSRNCFRFYCCFTTGDFSKQRKNTYKNSTSTCKILDNLNLKRILTGFVKSITKSNNMLHKFVRLYYGIPIESFCNQFFLPQAFAKKRLLSWLGIFLVMIYSSNSFPCSKPTCEFPHNKDFSFLMISEQFTF